LRGHSRWYQHLASETFRGRKKFSKKAGNELIIVIDNHKQKGGGKKKNINSITPRLGDGKDGQKARI